ncbi:TonB-dependent receptor [Acinetobacter terrae]|jgi:iron complex outermembrane receptor protein|uniref:TonB-dependent receptor n=1 Tax=Acinetobacter terrae TaxID=2731247 RepID=A0ABX1V5N0_9GAMM|nr:TonB-dependent receptor [Acinetobacter terrae]NNH88905.1 TonB-dependent receptor [Acinetobacter terrae]OAL86305.1 TonB-dependent receptor [Acinetobacter terrae]
MQGKYHLMPINMTLLCLTACICQNLYAETGSTEPVLLPTLKIEATRTDTDWLQTPASVYRIDQNKNENNLGVNLSETLKGVPGLQLNNRENYAQDLQISMRGFGARSTFGVRGIRLYVDGIPATMPDGQGQTSNIDLSSLDHIEVLGGPFSSLYGNSSGGTILTTTKEGEGRDSIQLGYSRGSHNKGRADIVLQGGTDQANEPSYVISSSYFDTDGYREHSAAKKVLSNAKLTWDLDDGSKVNWIVNHVDINADDPQGLTRVQWKANPKQQVPFLKQFDVRKEINQTQTGLTWSKPINDQHEIYGMVYAGHREVTQYQSIPKGVASPDLGLDDNGNPQPSTSQMNPRHAGGVIDFSRDYYGTDLRWTGKDLLPNTRLTAGLAFDYMDENRQGYENFDANNQFGVKGNLRRDEKNTLWNLDPYLQASWSFLPNWTLDTGLRYSNVHYESKDAYFKAAEYSADQDNGDDSGKTDYDKVLPSAALTWKINDQLNAYASYAKGFETPTFTEMAYSKNDGMNFDLKPATSDNYELGLKSQNQLGNFTAAIFQSNTQDDIVSAGTENGRATYRNADKTLRKGLELSWNKNLWRDLTAQASYSFIDATFDSDISNTDPAKVVAKGNYIPGVAKNQAFVALAWQPETGFNAGLDVRYIDKLYVDDINSDAAPSYTLTSANVGYVWKNADWKVRTFARVDNLFDEDYVGSIIVNDGNGRFFEPADGVNWSAGLSLTKAF